MTSNTGRADDIDLAEETEGEEGSVFPPAERRLVTQPIDISVHTLSAQWKDKVLLLPDIQREYVWDDKKASKLIESLILNIPIPIIYFAETSDAKYEIFDGHQRVRSIARFLNNEFALSGLSVLSEYNKMKFFNLPEREQRFLLMRTIRAVIILIDSHPNMKFEIYERLNTGSIMLNAQELRNSIYRGRLNDLLHQLAKDRMFRTLIGTSHPRRRMADEELILRFFAMHAKLPAYRPPLKRFLNEFMNSNRDPSEEQLEALRELFHRTVRLVGDGLGSHAFRILNADGSIAERSVNRALYEAEMLAFSWISPDGEHTLSTKLTKEVARLFGNETFVDSIRRATGDRARTFTRVREMVAAFRRTSIDVLSPIDLTTP